MGLEWWMSKGKGAIRRVLMRCGVNYYHESEDRRVLETIILPALAARPDVRKILFVGCAWYTRGYREIFRKQEYITIEVEPQAARFGARRHIVDSLENVAGHFAPGELDAIVCNGVFGWGLNDRAAVEKAFAGCFEALREGGVFVLGWNDVPEHTPFPLPECEALRKFAPLEFAPLNGSVFVTPTYNRHTFAFYRKEEKMPRAVPLV